jgi:prepilin-type N-terminal cleavage/methylation domain-containing protein
MRCGDAPLRIAAFTARSGAAHGRGRAGFTLLELVVTLSIIAIAGAVALPRYGRALARYRAELGGRRVVADLERARQRARATGSTWQIVFDSAGYTVQPVMVVNAADVTRVIVSRDPYLGNLQKINFGGDATVFFDGFGVPDSGGSLVVNSGIAAYGVDLDPQAGKARYQRYTGVFIANGG